MNSPSSSFLANTGSDIFPWLIVAGIVVLLGVVALVISQVVRSRKTVQPAEDASAEPSASAASAAPEADDAAAAGQVDLPEAGHESADTPGEDGSISPEDQA